MRQLCVGTPILILIGLLCVFGLEDKENTVTRTKRSLQTAGLGCDIIRPNLIREPIPGTDLNTGTFYIIRMKHNQHEKSALAFGYITWSGARHPSGFQYVFADSHHKMERYTEGADWYKDSQWAFLKSKQAGWYYFTNCGYPFKYATWSNMEEEDDGSGAFPMTLDIAFPGNHSKEDFLFRPVKMGDEGNRVFHLETKSFDGGIVSVSQTHYAGESNFLQVESMGVWEKRVRRMGKGEEKNAVFVFDDAKEEDASYSSSNVGSAREETCLYRQSFVFVALVSILAFITVYLCYSKKSILIQIIDHNMPITVK